MTRIIDCFTFFNELDLLEIRLETLYEHVDMFVITECRQSHAGKPKSLYLSDNISRFAKFGDKMVVQVLDKFPAGIQLFEADWFQREFAKSLIDSEMKPADYLLYGDVDEIPNPTALKEAVAILKNRPELEVAHFAMDMFFYFVNLRETSGTLLSYMGEYPQIPKGERKWLGSTLNTWSSVKSSKLTDLRRPERKANGVRIENAGWHFSWIGGHDSKTQLERVQDKLFNTAHQEFNTWINRILLKPRIKLRLDLIGRRTARFKLEKDLKKLPEFIGQNYAKFQYLFTK